MSDHLLQALFQLLSSTEIYLVSERPWHSRAFAGTQASFSATLSGKDHAVTAAQFARQLSEQEFDIPGQLVADIAVTEKISDEHQTRLIIDALLLND